jgi:O-antigen biosynthesis protein
VVRVHADAFFLHPVKYLQAVAWRVRGLRVRSRNRFAALKGQSPKAYALWMVTKEQPAIRAGVTVAGSGQATIIPVIDCTEARAGAEKTVDSVLRGSFKRAPIVVGPQQVRGADQVNRLPELAGILGPGDVWLCLLNPGDEVSPYAGEIYAAAAAREPQRSVIYADDDLTDERAVRHSPHFKPAWNPELFENHDFLCGAAIVRTNRAQLEGLDANHWPQGLIRQAAASAEPLHLPFVLHHRRQRPGPNPPVRMTAPSALTIAQVEVIIPTRDGVDLLRTCVDGLRRTNYPDLGVTIVDNGSDDSETLAYLDELARGGVRVLRMPGPFNYSALNNAAVRETKRQLLCFLNNDIEINDPEWLNALVRQAIRQDRGAVGARLIYSDGTIQHAGVVTGIGGGAGHAHRFQRVGDAGYFHRASLPQRVSAVTAACLVVARDKFLAVDGFDETQFPVAFNDVDLCLKLNSRGWQSFYEPAATLVHHESKSRGGDRDRIGKARLAAELQALKRKWHTDRVRDPYHHVHLSPFSEQFVIAV